MLYFQLYQERILYVPSPSSPINDEIIISFDQTAVVFFGWHLKIKENGGQSFILKFFADGFLNNLKHVWFHMGSSFVFLSKYSTFLNHLSTTDFQTVFKIGLCHEKLM